MSKRRLEQKVVQMLSILQNAISWIYVFTMTSNARKIKQRVKVYELRMFDFFVKTSFHLWRTFDFFVKTYSFFAKYKKTLTQKLKHLNFAICIKLDHVQTFIWLVVNIIYC